MIKRLCLHNLSNEKGKIKTYKSFFFFKNYVSEAVKRNISVKNKKDGDAKKKIKKENNANEIKEELEKQSFLKYNLKTDIYIKLNELNIYTPTEIQKTVIPLLLHKTEQCTNVPNEKAIGKDKHDIYNNILKNRYAVNDFLKRKWNIQKDFYDISKYDIVDDGEDVEQKKEKEVKRGEEREEENQGCVPSDNSNKYGEYECWSKCFNDVYLIVSPEKSGKTLSYFIPMLHNFYVTNEKRMNYLKNFYYFLNKNNYKKCRNKLFRKKEKLRMLRRKDNLFFDITYAKYKVNNRYIHVRTYRNCNNISYIKNKRNNALNCLKHKKNISFPFAVILTNTREAAFELFSFLKNFDINIELLTGGYKNKLKSVKQSGVEYSISYDNPLINKMTSSIKHEPTESSQLQGEKEDNNSSSSNNNNNNNNTIDTNYLYQNEHQNELLRTELKKRNMKKKDAINYNIDILIGTPDKILEKVENYKNKHLYNFKCLKYVIIEEADSLCNIFNESKTQLVLNHIKKYTNMYYYYYYCDHYNNSGDVFPQNESRTLFTETEKIEKQKEKQKDLKKKKEKGVVVNSPYMKRKLKKVVDEEIPISYKKDPLEIYNKKRESVKNIKNTIDSNIPILVFVSALKTVAITDFLKNNIKSKYIQHIVNINSHNINNSVKHIFINSKNKEKVSLLLELLESEKKSIISSSDLTTNSLILKKYIIFCNTSRSVKNLTNILTELKYKAGAIHSEMNFKERSTSYRKFRKNEINILVCTNIFSRGVVFENAEIINYDLNNNVNDYIYKSNKISTTNGINRSISNISNSISSSSSSSSGGALTTFFTKKNSGVINEIIDKTTNKKQIVFQNLNKKVSKLLKLYTNYYDVIKKKQRRKKKGGRKAMRIAPRRNCMSKHNKILSKKIYFYHKMNQERMRLIKKGILKPHQKIPRFPNRRAEVFDSNEYNTMNKLADGSLQIVAKKRKTKKKTTEQEGHYEENTIVLENMPTYEEEAEIREKAHQRKTYF